MKFTDGDITVNGSKIDRAFTYRRLNNLFEFNRMHGQRQSDHAPAHPKVTVEYTPTQKSSLVEDVIEATVGAIGNLFTLVPGFEPEEQAFQNAIKKEEARRKRKLLLSAKLF